MMLAILVGAALAATPTELGQTLAAFNRTAVYPLPKLSHGDLQRLASKKVVKLRETGSADSAQRAIGLVLLDRPRDAVWVSARNEDGSYASMSNLKIPAVGAVERWYQHLDVPFPFTDRHWVIDVWDNHELAAAGPCWEHPWRLAASGGDTARASVVAGRVGDLTAKQFDGSLKVPVNNGAWVACQFGPEETLLVFHAQSVVGGNIPDRLVVDFTMMTLGKVLRQVDERAATAAEWYADDLVGGDGEPIVIGG